MEKQKKRQEEAEVAAREKEEQLQNLAEKVGEDKEQIDPETDISNMPDCVYKYKIILARAKAGKGKFTDEKFKASTESIGDTVISNNLGGT